MKFSHIEVKTREDMMEALKGLQLLGLQGDDSLMYVSIGLIDLVFSGPNSNILVSSKLRSFCGVGVLPSRLDLLRSNP